MLTSEHSLRTLWNIPSSFRYHRRMNTNRRAFLAAATWTAFSQSRIFGANDRIRVGVIGTGGRSRELMHCLESNGGNEVVGVCDVYQPRRDAAKSRAGSNTQEYDDYRR